MMARTIWVACLLSLLYPATAQDIAPANATSSGSDNSTGLELEILHGNDVVEHWSVERLVNGTAIPDDGFRGPAKLVDTQNALAIKDDEIAVLSCDPLGGFTSSSDLFQQAIDHNATAIVLYSTSSGKCTVGGAPSYQRIYGMTSIKDSKAMSDAAGSSDAVAWVARTETIGNAPSTELNNSNSGNGEGRSGSSSATSWGPSPSTAVAMIILYSITGIITALFLVIIITGAVRAHRHPERYGPRNIIGRPRQSRARGLARAMLETLPIVRFGESHEEGRNKPADVELAEGQHGSVEMVAGQEAAQHTSDGTRDAAQGDSVSDPAVAGGIAPATDRSNSTPEENQGCSICTDDFEVGQDQRVLPCDHRFHPACIDPWLLNVSGTCPLCRIDLRPQPSAEEELDAAGNPIRRDGDAMPPPLDSDHQRASLRRSIMIGLTGIGRPERLTREERLAAIRRYAEQQRTLREGENASAAEPVEEDSSMRRRLRNAFRVRTRRTGENGQTQEEAEAPAAATAGSEAARQTDSDGTPRAQS